MKALLLALLVSIPAHADQISIPSGTQREDAEVFVPDQYTNDHAWPVVLLLHGYLGSSGLIDSYFGFSGAVSQRGFLLVVPNGLKDSSGYRFWNATDGCCDFDHSQSDDLGFLKNLLREVRARYHVDASRIYVAGHSNGAFMAHRIACDPEAGVAAIASFAGAVSTADAGCAGPVSVLQIHALDDDTIRFNGDPKGYPKLAPYPGVSETMSRWLRRDGCGALQKGRALDLEILNPGPDTDEQVAQCSSGTTVALWTIRAYKSAFHTPHTPILRQEFTDKVLDFLLSKQRKN